MNSTRVIEVVIGEVVDGDPLCGSPYQLFKFIGNSA